MTADASGVDVDAVMADLHARVRDRLRRRLVAAGSGAFEDPALFADVEALLRSAVGTPDHAPLILPELLGEPETWRLTTALPIRSHRGPAVARLLRFVKTRAILPVFRWLHEYSRDNFERQRRTNHVLFACVQELALETALLRRELRRVAAGAPPAPPPRADEAHAHPPAGR